MVVPTKVIEKFHSKDVSIKAEIRAARMKLMLITGGDGGWVALNETREREKLHQTW